MIRRVLPSLLIGSVLAFATLGAAYPIRSMPTTFNAKHPRLAIVSTDPFTNSTSQHRTQVEPDVFAHGSTIVSAFQSGRFFDGGASDTGWATSTDSGHTWHHGFLPGITKIQDPSAPYDRVSDATVGYDAKHAKWLIADLPLIDLPSQAIGQMPIVNSSTDGLTWSNPVGVAKNNGDYIDKDWIACDNTTTSPYYGHCYVEFDDVDLGDLEMMTTSADGGQTWSAPSTINVSGLGGQPLVLPNGVVVVPYLDEGSFSISAFNSTNGGASWNSSILIDAVNDHGVAGNMRTSPLPSAQVDGSGRIYVTWQDCSFRANCSSNDIVMSTSTDGTHWSAESRIPIDAVNSTVDHFIPGIAADITTGGSSAHLGLTYYFFPQTNCSTSTCQLMAGFVGSQDSGQTWSAPVTLTNAMNVNWIAQTDQGQMVGDYIATAFSGGLAHGLFSVAQVQRNGKFVQHTTTTAAGLSPMEGMFRFSSAGERPLRGAHTDHARDRLPPLFAFGNV